MSLAPATRSTLLSSGFVAESPQRLAASVNRDVETYTLGRLMGSEEPRGSRAEKVAIAWAAVNEIDRYSAVVKRPVSLLERLSYVKNVGPTWRYGTQEPRRQGGGRYASTARDPSTEDLDIARDVLGGRIPDPTGGAQRFLNPRVQEQLAAEGRAGYDTLDEKIAQWSGEGWDLVPVAGVSPSRLLFFWKRGTRRGGGGGPVVQPVVATTGVGSLFAGAALAAVWWVWQKRRRSNPRRGRR